MLASRGHMQENNEKPKRRVKKKTQDARYLQYMMSEAEEKQPRIKRIL